MANCKWKNKPKWIINKNRLFLKFRSAVSNDTTWSSYKPCTEDLPGHISLFSPLYGSLWLLGPHEVARINTISGVTVSWFPFRVCGSLLHHYSNIKLVNAVNNVNTSKSAIIIVCSFPVRIVCANPLHQYSNVTHFNLVINVKLVQKSIL